MTANAPVQQIRVLASGSSGNATFVRVGEVRLLIDAGVSRRRLRAALAEIGETLESLDAILVTHEHGDHVSGLPVLQRTLPHVPLIATRGTMRKLIRKGEISGQGVEFIKAGESLVVGGLRVTSFPIPHDAAEPVGYRVESDSFAFVVATDLGKPTPEVRHALLDCQVCILEANHCPIMLRNGPYPPRLKRRVSSDHGHLSNDQARALLREIAGPRLEHVVLGHLSEENNTPQLALAAVAPALERHRSVTLTAAARTEPGPLLTFAPSEPRGRAAPPPRPARQAALPFDLLE